MAKTAFKSIKCSFSDILPIGHQSNLGCALKIDWISERLAQRREVAINLDQHVLHQQHAGHHMPVILASTNIMYGLLCGRPYTPKELLSAMGVPLYDWAIKAAGCPGGVAPISFEGCSNNEMKKMAGNTLNQACYGSLFMYALANIALAGPLLEHVTQLSPQSSEMRLWSPATDVD